VLAERMRTYREGDEAALVELWNRAFAGYGGYVPRTVLHWRWCILERPGLSPEDILVATQGDKAIGYGVLGPKGNVLEIAVDPPRPKALRRRLVGAICEALEARARVRGDEAIDFMVPSTDPVICQALKERGYREEAGDFLNMTIVNPVALIRRVLEHRRDRFPPGWTPTFHLSLTPGHYRFSPYPEIAVAIGNPPLVEGQAPARADYHIRTDLSVLTDLIFNRVTLAGASGSGALVVEPASGLDQVGTLMDLVALKLPWYSPYADAR